MRSKCRCSCVLQFTLCHAFSSVLHRPPSQLIHCIALCFGFHPQGVKNKIEINFHGWSLCPGKREKGGTKPGLTGETLAADYGTGGLSGSHPPQIPWPNQSRAGRRLARPKADKLWVQGLNFLVRGNTTPELFKHFSWQATKTFNDPSAGSPTETLLRLLLPLSATVWSSFR